MLYADLRGHHGKRDKTDNRVENLRWVTRGENLLNKGIQKNNISGHIGIYYQKIHKIWMFQKRINKKTYTKSFKTKRQALCYKYIFLLRQKAGHFN
jgi:hypothetical protein